eukprot:CAMPEP_0184742428 /NCGR_PEP_ID=MMETSP0315-20130426/5340_1 /TAXON_ID=101924 /ORGANISM="Rhodosorus marinus, Strain UTEX LB 2760" /LENGTH=109 /DNA_ID=CAMNT_0027213197 /DNA_START=109 /DNA_END=438 /DNA_ORIENTATION=-
MKEERELDLDSLPGDLVESIVSHLDRGSLERVREAIPSWTRDIEHYERLSGSSSSRREAQNESMLDLEAIPPDIMKLIYQRLDERTAARAARLTPTWRELARDSRAHRR